ncbi:MAG: response regulator [Candidatus Nitrosopumilus sp. bin_68KS]
MQIPLMELCSHKIINVLNCPLFVNHYKQSVLYVLDFIIIMTKPTVIVIDDYRDIAEVMKELLEFNSISVLATGHNGQDAVDLYKEHAPDVVVMDYLMPEFNGAYGLENIIKINPDAKVIMVTGSIDEKLHDELTKLGATAILPKPCKIGVLAETINDLSMDSFSMLTN